MRHATPARRANPAVGLLHPPLGAVASGGNVYDASVLACAKRSGSSWTSLVWPLGADVLGDYDVLLWDSLLLAHVRRRGGERLGLLLHYLPSLQPDHQDRAELVALEARAAEQADFVIATGRPLAETVRHRWPRLLVFVCEPGVGSVFAARVPPRRRQQAELLTVANLLPAKGHRGLLEVLLQLRAEPWRWHLAGEDDRRFGIAQALRARAAQAGIAKRLVFHGRVPQRRVASLMAGADLLLHPSAAESYGMVLAEAAASRLPAVSFRVGAAAELILHEETGLLAPPGDWQLFAAHVERLIREPALRAAFASRLAAHPVRRWDQTFAELQAAVAAALA